MKICSPTAGVEETGSHWLASLVEMVRSRFMRDLVSKKREGLGIGSVSKLPAMHKY